MTARKALITGIHTGLGHGLTRACLDDGWQVHGLSRQAPVELAQWTGVRFQSLDLRDFAAIPSALSQLLSGVDRLELVLLNAGILGKIRDLRDTSLEDLRAVMDVNVWANKVLLDTLLAGSIEVKQVVAISSGAAFNGSGGWGAYSISKSALNLLVRVYAHEHPRTHFSALAPGVLYTPMIETILSQPADPRYAANDRLRQAHAESRIVSAEVAARQLLSRVDELRERSSGAFADVRTM